MTDPEVLTALTQLVQALEAVLAYYVDIDSGFGPGEREVLEAAQRAMERAGHGGRP